MLAILLVAGTAPVVRAGTSDFVGSAACGLCHQDELAAWRAGPHARAARSLGTLRSAACLGCHTTGPAATGPVVDNAVGCEACHGAGRGYAPADVMPDLRLARALGLRDLSTADRRQRLCRSCHRARTRLAPAPGDAELAASWQRFGHGRAP